MSNSKLHYELLDWLRGVAALMVLWYHFFEGFAATPPAQIVNHGYLCVDFFFILSEFVIGYAYDRRWSNGLTTGEFMRRRLIRLHPMVLVGVVLGVGAFLLQGSVTWNGTRVSIVRVLAAAVLNLFMLPALPDSGVEVRGNGEMFPLNGPNWSLFFEYVGSVLYAVIIRRLSTRWLASLVGALGVAVAWYALSNQSGYGHMGVGWSLAGTQLLGGFLRMSFSFSIGLLLSRVFKPITGVRNAFWVCSVGIVLLVGMPFVGQEDSLWQNALYDAVCILLFFPGLVWLGASGNIKRGGRVCRFLGDISYPLYAVHYPSLYLFFAWIWGEGLALSDVWWMCIPIFAGNILLAYVVLKCYDEPVRRWLSRPRNRLRVDGVIPK